MLRVFASLFLATPCLALAVSLQVPPAAPLSPAPVQPTAVDDEEAAKKMVETVQWALERAKTEEMPTDAAALAAELKRTREAVLLLDAFTTNAVRRLQEQASSRTLADAADAYLRFEGWKEGRVKGSIRVEKEYGSDTYWIIDCGGFEDCVVDDGGFMGWNSWNPDRFWCKSRFDGFEYIKSGGLTSKVSEASISSDLKRRILSRF
jgi:hypothetical protein